MNEQDRICNRWKKVVECLDDKAQDEKCIESLQKQTMGIIQFSKQILSYWPSKLACVKSSSCLISFAAMRNAMTKAW